MPIITTDSNNTTVEWTAMFGEYEDLDPELQDYVNETETFGMGIRHPLVYSIMHFPQMNARANKQLASKKAALVEAEAEGDWHSYVYLHERPYRIMGFEAVAHRMTDAYYWELLGSIWCDSENIEQNPRLWENLLRSERPEREQIMQPQERETLRDLPASIPVYQGHTTRRHDGWSWTTNFDKAVWFARRFANIENSFPVVTAGKVKKSSVIAYFDRRGEFEIVAPRRCVTDRKAINL